MFGLMVFVFLPITIVCGFFSGETLASGRIFREGGVAMLSTGEVSIIRKQRFRTWFRLIAPTVATFGTDAAHAVDATIDKKAHSFTRGPLSRRAMCYE